MARYFASVRGGRGDAHRIGSARSGIRANCRGWRLGVTVFGRPDPTNPDLDEFHVYATAGSDGGGCDRLLGVLRVENGQAKFEVEERS